MTADEGGVQSADPAGRIYIHHANTTSWDSGSVVEIPEGRTAEEVFRELAGRKDADWAMMTAEVQDALDGQPSLLGLFVRGGDGNKGG